MKQLGRIGSVFAFGLACTGMVVACSSDDTTTPASTQQQTVTVHVSAQSGGTVSDPAGKTTLVIPPGALAVDTDITLTTLPKSGSAVVDIAEFGPNGLQFLQPATLSIKADASLAPEGKSLAVALEEGGAFKAVEGSAFANGVASAPLSHFSKYSIIVIDGGQVIAKPPAACDGIKSAFTACGGDPKGTWVFKELCVEPPSFGDAAACPTLTGSVDVEINRDVTIDETTIQLAAGTITASIQVNYPRSCANNADCSQLKDGFKAESCTENAGICECALPKDEKAQEAESMSYTLSGSTITTDEDSLEFCVQGTKLTVKSVPKEAGKTPSYWVLEKK